ncbi:O-antigen ligase family protein [Microbacterium sp. SORGH_AS_0888]|uniref:tetratricopeptide repeat protein n=1 Tax=Microbacterium sp. SORGH_AS_0888 TaxID=3041791 RepID=UPI0027867296|nr:O-antigen ligase family protein [Microbacterium sp. SORGH_AS_0888]MDQ1130475.1 O-antigen ligase [Microbacterium sp. SORGH_AS_0888]
MSRSRSGGATARRTPAPTVPAASRIALALLWAAPVLLLPVLYERWGWPVLIVATAGIAVAVWAPAAGRLPVWLLAFAVAGGVLCLVGASFGHDSLGALLGRAPRYEGIVVAVVLLGAVWAGARLLGPEAAAPALRAMLITVAVAALALGGIALLEAVGLRPIDTDLVRPGSLAGNATDQGILGVVFGGILVHLGWGAWRRTGIITGWAVGGLVGALVAVVTSASRAAFLAAAVVGVVFAARAVLGARRRRRALGIAAGAAIVLVAVMLVIPDVRDRLLATDWLAAKTIGDRFTIWRDALSLVVAHPWTGVGPSGYMDAVTGVFDDDWYRNVTPDHILDSPHNVALQLALAGGIPLLALVTALAVVVGIVGVRAARAATGARRDLTIAALAVIPAVVLALLTSPTSPKTLLPLALLGGMLVARGVGVDVGVGGGSSRAAWAGGVAAQSVARQPAAAGWRWVATGVIVAWGIALSCWTVADAFVLNGVRAALSGRFADADAQFGGAATWRPWDADIDLIAARAFGGALAQGMAGAGDDAARWADRAADALPASAAAQEAAGAVALAQSRWSEAVARLDVASRLSPANPRIAHERGLAALATGDVATARDSLARAVELSPDSAESRAALADVCARLGDRSGACAG